jgi:hypothetical protein
MPLMLFAIVAAARWLVRHTLPDNRTTHTLSIGLLALSLVLTADLAVGMFLRGMSAREVFFRRDPVSGTAYYLSLVLFALMPTLLAIRRR